MFEKNPCMQIFYMSLAIGMYIAWFFGIFLYLDGKHMSSLHNIFIFAGITLSIVSFIVACKADPGVVTKLNYPIFEKAYPYDGYLHSEVRFCKHCGIIKPPRTRHCSTCGCCIARNDHHCPCVGAGNYRYFLLFLLTNGVTCGYIAYVAIKLLYYFVNADGMFGKQVRLRNGQVITIGWKIALTVILNHRMWTSIAVMFSVCLCIALLSFFFYHVYLFLTNTSTLETLKWKRLKQNRKDAMQIVQGKSFIRDLPPTYVDDLKDDLKEKHVNRYSKGLISNLMEVIIPPHTRQCNINPLTTDSSSAPTQTPPSSSSSSLQQEQLSTFAPTTTFSSIIPHTFPNRPRFHWMNEPTGGEIERHRKERKAKDERRKMLLMKQISEAEQKKEEDDEDTSNQSSKAKHHTNRHTFTKEELENVDEKLNAEEWKELFLGCKEEILKRYNTFPVQRVQQQKMSQASEKTKAKVGKEPKKKLEKKEAVKEGSHNKEKIKKK
ncbi:putative palmitoyltransferase [Monocercomonoides exilis]|uniref:putative palmitoyltransferase n=1 Tax=Monocercomonoides exilis TaxID=2049356 RepID=UPI003559910E|nr:putative palmitoyltransferase [Monocercomonoides exilis]